MVGSIVLRLASGKGSLFDGRLLGRPGLPFHYGINDRARYAQADDRFLVPVLELRGILPTELFEIPRGIGEIAVDVTGFYHGNFSLLLKLNFSECVVVFSFSRPMLLFVSLLRHPSSRQPYVSPRRGVRGLYVSTRGVPQYVRIWRGVFLFPYAATPGVPAYASLWRGACKCGNPRHSAIRHRDRAYFVFLMR